MKHELNSIYVAREKGRVFEKKPVQNRVRGVPFSVFCIEKKRFLDLKYQFSYGTLVLCILCQKATFSAWSAFGSPLYYTFFYIPVLTPGFRSDMYRVI